MFSIHQLLIFAARAGNLDSVRERIQSGADLSYYDKQHGAALFEAIHQHHLPVVELLLSHGANPNMTDSRGHGPLEHALRLRDDAITHLLLRCGAQLQPHALPRFRVLLSDCLERRGPRNDTPPAKTDRGPSVQ